MDRSWEYINRSETHDNVETGAEAAQFPEKEYINEISVSVQTRKRRCCILTFGLISVKDGGADQFTTAVYASL